MSPLLQQMLTENPVMSAAMQQMMTPGLASLPSSADLLQQAHALQLLAQLQSVLLMNTSQARDQQQSNKVRIGQRGLASRAFILSLFECCEAWCMVYIWLYAMLLSIKFLA